MGLSRRAAHGFPEGDDAASVSPWNIGCSNWARCPSSLSDFGNVGCECAAAAHFLPSSCPIVPLWGGESGKNWSRWGAFSLSTPKVRQAASAVFDAICDIKPRLFGPGCVANPRDTTRYRCGLRLAQTKNPSVLFVSSSIKHCTRENMDRTCESGFLLWRGGDKQVNMKADQYQGSRRRSLSSVSQVAVLAGDAVPLAVHVAWPRCESWDLRKQGCSPEVLPWGRRLA